MGNDGDAPPWHEDLLQRLEDNRWPLVFVICAVLIRLRLMLFAIALPVMVYWKYNVSEAQEEEQQQEQDEGNQQEDEVNERFEPDAAYENDMKDNFDFGGPVGRDLDATSPGFWGDATQDKGEKQYLGPSRPTKKTDSLASDPLQSSLGDDFGLGLGSDPFGASVAKTADSTSSGNPLAGLGLGGGSSFLDGDGGFSMPDFDLGGGGMFGGGGFGGGGGKGKSKDKGGEREADPRQLVVLGLGDLPEEEVRAFFEDVGEVVRCKVLDGKGMGFVTYRSEPQAQDAVRRLNGTELCGRRLTVRVNTQGRPKGEGGGKGGDKGGGGFGGGGGGFGGGGGGFGGGGGGFGGGGGRDFGPATSKGADPKQVFVSGVAELNENEIRSFFESIGAVERLKVLTHPDGMSKGSCFVTFRDEEMAQKAIGMTGSEIEGFRVNIRPATGSGGGKGGKDGKGDDRGGGGGFGGPPRDGGGFGGGGFGGGRDIGSRDDFGTPSSKGRGRDGDSKGGGFGRPPPKDEPRTEMDDMLEEALDEDGGVLQLGDFHAAAKRFLTDLMVIDGEQCVQCIEMVLKTCKGKDRTSVQNMPAYVYALIQKFDPEMTDAVKARQAEKRRGKDGESGAGDVKRAWRDLPSETPEGAKQVLDRWGKPVLIY